MLHSLTSQGSQVFLLPTCQQKGEKRERAYPASIASDPFCPVTAQNISKASYNTFNNIPRLENTDSNPDDLNKTKQRKHEDRKFILKSGK